MRERAAFRRGSVLMVAVTGLAATVMGRSATAAGTCPNVRVPTEYVNYFLKNLEPALRERCRAMGEKPSATFSRFDDDDTPIAPAGTDWDSLRATDGIVAGPAVRYRDASGCGQYASGSYAFVDTDGDGGYRHGTDVLIAGSATAANKGEWGKSAGLCYADTDANGRYDMGEPLWYDRTNLASALNSFQAKLTAIIPRYLDTRTPLGDTLRPPLPAWNETNLLAHIGAATRLPAPTSDPRDLPAWFAQQTAILAALTRYHGPAPTLQGQGSSDIYAIIAEREKAARGQGATTPYEDGSTFMTFSQLSNQVDSFVTKYIDDTGGAYAGGASRPKQWTTVPGEVTTCRALYACVASLQRTLEECSTYYVSAAGQGRIGYCGVRQGQAMMTGIGDDVMCIGWSEQQSESAWDPARHESLLSGAQLGKASSLVWEHRRDLVGWYCPDPDGWSECYSYLQAVSASACVLDLSARRAHAVEYYLKTKAACGSYALAPYPEGTYVRFDTGSSTMETVSLSAAIGDLNRPPWPQLGPRNCWEDSMWAGCTAEGRQGYQVTDFFAVVSWTFTSPAAPTGSLTGTVAVDPQAPAARGLHVYILPDGDRTCYRRVAQGTAGCNAEYTFTNTTHYLEDVSASLVVVDAGVSGGFTMPSAPTDVPVPIESPEAALNTLPDSNRDDLVDVGADLRSFGPDTGTIGFELAHAEPQVLIPLGTDPWSRALVHVYLVQGGFTGLGNTTWLYPDARDEGSTTEYTLSRACRSQTDGLSFALSLHTRARLLGVANMSTDHLKRVEIVRPRGNVVVFDFPWNAATQSFNAVGFPQGINAARTYVLRDTTPTNHGDLSFELHFDSGTIHTFAGGNGGITGVRHINGLSMSVTAPVGGTVVSPRYECSVRWAGGQPASLSYASRLSPSDAIAVALVSDAAGRVVRLDKSIAALSVTLTGNTIAFGTGITVARTGTNPVALTTTVPDAAAGLQTYRTEYTLNDRGLVTRETHELGASSATWQYLYPNTTDRCPTNGAPLWGKPQTIRHPDGSWECFKYAADTGWVAKHITPFKDSGEGAGDSASRVEEFSYDAAMSTGVAADPARLVERPRRAIIRVLGAETGREYHGYDTGVVTATRVCRTPGAAWNAADNLRITRAVANCGPDCVDGPTVHRDYTFSGAPASPLSVQMVEKNERGETITTVTNPFGYVESTRTEVSGLVLHEAVGSRVDAWGRPHSVAYTHDGTSETFEDIQWHGGAGSTTHRDGSLSTQRFCSTGTPAQTTHYGVTTTHTYDATGNLVRSTAVGDSLSTTSEWQYDALGRLRREKDAFRRTTLYDYDDNNRTLTVTTPDLAERIEQYFRDGSLRSIGGTGAYPEEYDYGVEGGAAYSEVRRPVPAGTYADCRRSYCNALGQVCRVTQSDGTPTPKTVSTTTFDDKARPVTVTDADGVCVVATYNQRHEIIKQTVGNQTMAYDHGVKTYGGKTVRYSKVTGCGNTRETYAAVDGTQSWDITNGRTAATAATRDFTHAPGKMTVSQTYPDGTAVVTAYSAALPETVTCKDAGGAVTRQESGAYDALRRPVSATANGKTTELKRDTDGAVRKVSSLGAGYAEWFEIGTDACGRFTSLTSSDGGAVAVERDTRGKVSKVSGTGVLPQRVSHTRRGLLDGITTFRGGMDGLGPVTTGWEYNLDGTPRRRCAGPVTLESYDYTPAGRLREVSRPYTRTDGSAGVLKQSLSYSPADGSLRNLEISDSGLVVANLTPTFDANGRLTALAEPQGTWGIAYDADGAPNSVAIPYVPGGAQLGYMHRAQDGRLTQLNLTVAGRNLLTVEYGYDAAGRLSLATANGVTASYGYVAGENLIGTVSFAANGNEFLRHTRSYDFRDRLALVDGTLDPAGDSPVTVSRYAYPAHTIEGRRQQAHVSVFNPATPAAPVEVHWKYEYAIEGQLAAATCCWDAGFTQPLPDRRFSFLHDTIANRLTGGLLTPAGTPAEEYTANELNQYEVRSVAGEFHLSGFAAADATVTVTCAADTASPVVHPTVRHGEHFTARIAVDNHAGPVLAHVTVTAVRFDLVSQQDIVSERSGVLHIPAASTAIAHRSAGERETDGLRACEWDALGRLTAVETPAGAPVPARRVFAYDFQGHCVSRLSYAWNPAAGGWTLTETRLTIYDGWQPIAEGTLDSGGAFVLERTYAWGSDQSGTLGAAAGVGGLLALTVYRPDGTTVTYVPTYDGNGNITTYVDAGAARVVASFEYAPFGGLLGVWYSSDAVQADLAEAPRFSTKLFDKVSGLYYFGYRWYDPVTGRWLSRDPLGEQGGLNLYAYCQNDPINQTDPLGLAWWNPFASDFAVWQAGLAGARGLGWAGKEAWDGGTWTAGTALDVTGATLNYAAWGLIGDKGMPEHEITNNWVHTPNGDFLIIFVNGVACDEKNVEGSRDELADRTKQRVGYIVNKTGVTASQLWGVRHLNAVAGVPYDVLQAAAHKLGMRDSTVSLVVATVKHQLDCFRWTRGKIILVGHSQGGAILASAWLRLKRELTPEECQRVVVITAAGANDLGFPGAAEHIALGKPPDCVSYVLGYNSLQDHLLRLAMPWDYANARESAVPVNPVAATLSALVLGLNYHAYVDNYNQAVASEIRHIIGVNAP